jgi:hypothetical protein
MAGVPINGWQMPKWGKTLLHPLPITNKEI